MRLKEKISSFCQRFFHHQQADDKAPLLLLKYEKRFFHLVTVAVGAKPFVVALADIGRIPNLIDRLSTQDACLLGVTLGEIYGKCHDEPKQISFPSNTATSKHAEMRFYKQDSFTSKITLLDCVTKKKDSHDILKLIKSSSLIAKLSNSDSYRIGFAAGEKIYQQKKALNNNGEKSNIIYLFSK